jgi:uncharacterized protein (TIGR02246 family)
VIERLRAWACAVLFAALGAPLASAQEPDVDTARIVERLQRLEDVEAIRRLIFDYGRLLDAQDFESFSELFAADGEWVGGGGATVGPEAIRQTMEAAFGPGSGVVWGSSFHVLGNEVVDLNGDAATAVSRWMFVQAGEDGAPAFVLAGRYRDEFVRAAGIWRIKRRELVNDMALEGFPGAPPSED